MKKTVLEVKIDDINMNEAVILVANWLKRSGKHYIVTPNPEFLVTAKDNNQFQKILNRADLAIPDGVGLRLAGVKNRVSGTDLMESLVKLAAGKDYTIGLLGGRDGVADLCAERLVREYPSLKVVFISEEWKKALKSTIDILFVAFGHPKQEIWIYENLPKIPVKVAMGVGGAFDYISGKVHRAPGWIRSLGLEWLFRLILQPWRAKRQLALIKYIYLLTRYMQLR